MSFDEHTGIISGGEILSLFSLKIGEQQEKSLFNKWI
jgi:hypothetical protein